MIIIEIILLLWLLAMSIIDIRKGSFSGKYLFFALVFFSVAIGILCFLNLKDWKSVVSGGAAGSVFLIASNVTQGAIGLGDGYILTICGIVMGLYQSEKDIYSERPYQKVDMLPCLCFWNFIMGS